MKKINFIRYATIVLVLFLQSFILAANTPQKVSYQSIVRDATGALVKSSTVGIRISILQGSVSGTAVYVETHSVTTNVNGLATLEVGNGTPVTGTFSAIDWSTNPFFLKVETDPAGGTAYSITGTSEILSVPYALYSKNAEKADSVLNESQNLAEVAAINDSVNTQIKNVTNPTDAQDAATKAYVDILLDKIAKLEKAVFIPKGGISSLLFTSTKEGNSEIYKSGLDSSNIVCLTNNPADDFWARFNPTGDKIGFVSNRSGQYEVYTMNLDGSNIQKITTVGIVGGQYGNSAGVFDWTNDGKIIYTRGRALCKVNIDGSNNETIWTTPSNRNLARVACSRTSNKVAIQIMGPWAYDSEIYLMNTDGTNPTIIEPNEPGTLFLGKFTPDGNKIFFSYDLSGHEESSGRSLDDHIVTVNLDGSGKIDLSSNKPIGTNDLDGAFLSSGDKLVFENINNSGPGNDIWIMNSDGTKRTKVIMSAWIEDEKEIFQKTYCDLLQDRITIIEKTLFTIPAITTDTISNITDSTATCGGNISSDGGLAVSARGVCWSTSENPTIDDNKTTDGNGTGRFTSNLADMTSNTIYYLRAYATNNLGTGYGEQVSFKTFNLSNGLIAYYPFNGNANDESGNNNNGVINGAVSAINRFGVANKSFSFDSITSNISIDDNPSFHSLNQITISVWFNATDSSNFWTKLVGKHFDASGGSFYLIWEHNYVRFSAITDYQYGGLTSDNLILGSWHHACGVYNGTLMELYIDGLLVNSVPNSGVISETNYPITIGISERWNEFFYGSIDDIRIYNRALTNVEVLQLFHEGGWIK
jgi:Tol biopolymer transport system component